ncbi:MAG: adenosine kinase [Victivallales bacterium]|nr:adenosine kinase [Victivallales bacterium]
MSLSPTLLGVGDVILDLALPITDEEFALLRLPIPRGQVMQVSSAEQQAILTHFAPERLTRHPGGSCANTLRAYAWHGRNAKLLGLAGDDEAADCFMMALQKAGVDISGIRRIPGHATNCCLALVTPEGERTMLPCFDAGALATGDTFQAGDFDDCQCIHLEGYNLRHPDMLQAVLEWAEDRQLRLSLDLSDVSLIRAHRDEMERILHSHHFTCLFANGSEAREFAKCETACEAISVLGTHADCAVVTCGAQGVWIAISGNSPFQVPAVKPTALVDTIGAGDSFEGAFLASFYSGATPFEAAQCAAAFAAQVIALPGATLPPMAPLEESNAKVTPAQSVQ